MKKTAAIAPKLDALVTATEVLLAKAGRLSEDYDSARLTAALGHLTETRDELRQAALVARATGATLVTITE